MTSEQIYQGFREDMRDMQRHEIETLSGMLFEDEIFARECGIEFRRAVYITRVDHASPWDVHPMP